MIRPVDLKTNPSKYKFIKIFTKLSEKTLYTGEVVTRVLIRPKVQMFPNMISNVLQIIANLVRIKETRVCRCAVLIYSRVLEVNWALEWVSEIISNVYDDIMRGKMRVEYEQMSEMRHLNNVSHRKIFSGKWKFCSSLNWS